jgi:hypothetical protein
MSHMVLDLRRINAQVPLHIQIHLTPYLIYFPQCTYALAEGTRKCKMSHKADVLEQCQMKLGRTSDAADVRHQ